jgi:DNA-binding MarR family transcriptional regulator
MAKGADLGLMDVAGAETGEPTDSANGDSPAVEFGPLSDLAAFMLRIAQVQLYGAFFAEFGPRDIRPGQIGILVAIDRNPGIRQGVLADALRIKWSNMAKIIRLLDQDGLIERRVSDDDRRAIELRLTGKGHDLVAEVVPQLAANDRAATAMLNDGERRTLLRLLHKIAGQDGAGESGARS